MREAVGAGRGSVSPRVSGKGGSVDQSAARVWETGPAGEAPGPQIRVRRRAGPADGRGGEAGWCYGGWGGRGGVRGDAGRRGCWRRGPGRVEHRPQRPARRWWGGRRRAATQVATPQTDLAPALGHTAGLPVRVDRQQPMGAFAGCGGSFPRLRSLHPRTSGRRCTRQTSGGSRTTLQRMRLR